MAEDDIKKEKSNIEFQRDESALQKINQIADYDTTKRLKIE